MSRDRRRITPYKANVELLEPRQMLSVGREPVLPLAITELRAKGVGPNLDGWAENLVQHPRQSAAKGLGALVSALRDHGRLAAHEGWGTVLAMELADHPYYTATHHLAGLLAPPTSSPAPVPSSSTPAPLSSPKTPPSPSPTVPASPVVPSPPTAPSAPPLAPSNGSSGTPGAPTAAPPVSVLSLSLAAAVGQTLGASIVPGGLTGSAVTYTITPQPLPAHMTFNRGNGMLHFAPAPGQSGTFSFTVTASNGNESYVEPVIIAVTQAQLTTTELSGQVVGQAGKPLADMPVKLDGETIVTNAAGDFTLANVSVNPGPLGAGGSVAASQDRQALEAPGCDPNKRLRRGPLRSFLR